MGKDDNKTDGNERTEIISSTYENKQSIKTNNKIECVTASFRNLKKDNVPIQNAVVYVWISHNNEEYNNDLKMMAVADLLPKIFDQATCSMYQVNTGFLSRYNYLSAECGITDAEEKGRIEQKNWEEKREKNFSTLKLKKINWEDCIDSSKNPYFEDCRTIIIDKRKENTKLDDSFKKTVDTYANKHNIIKANGDLYVTEETSWLLSLSLLHPRNKKIFIIHLGDSSKAIESLFKEFTLSTSMKWLSPNFGDKRTYKSLTEFRLEYRNNELLGFSYAVENPKAKPDEKSIFCTTPSIECKLSIQNLFNNDKEFITMFKNKISSLGYKGKLFISIKFKNNVLSCESTSPKILVDTNDQSLLY